MQKVMTATYEFSAGLLDSIKKAYVTIGLSVLGICALITATIIAWPAVAYLASKLI